MKTLSAIKSRRSVRSFSTKKPDWRDIIEALHSSQYAPMAGGVFSLNFILIDNSELIEKISKWAEQEWINEAKYLVVFISNPKKVKILYKERGDKYIPQQAGAAIQNFILHLTDVGLSTCWVGHFNEEKIKDILKIPEDKIIEAIFPIGYEKSPPEIKEAKGNLDSALNFNEWGQKEMKEIKKIEGRGPEFY